MASRTILGRLCGSKQEAAAQPLECTGCQSCATANESRGPPRCQHPPTVTSTAGQSVTRTSGSRSLLEGDAPTARSGISARVAEVCAVACWRYSHLPHAITSVRHIFGRLAPAFHRSPPGPERGTAGESPTTSRARSHAQPAPGETLRSSTAAAIERWRSLRGDSDEWAGPPDWQ